MSSQCVGRPRLALQGGRVGGGGGGDKAVLHGVESGRGSAGDADLRVDVLDVVANGGFPVDAVLEVSTVINPTTAEV